MTRKRQRMLQYVVTCIFDTDLHSLLGRKIFWQVSTVAFRGVVGRASYAWQHWLLSLVLPGDVAKCNANHPLRVQGNFVQHIKTPSQAGGRVILSQCVSSLITVWSVRQRKIFVQDPQREWKALRLQEHHTFAVEQ